MFIEICVCYIMLCNQNLPKICVITIAKNYEHHTCEGKEESSSVFVNQPSSFFHFTWQLEALVVSMSRMINFKDWLATTFVAKTVSYLHIHIDKSNCGGQF